MCVIQYFDNCMYILLEAYMAKNSLVGLKFGRLTVVAFSHDKYDSSNRTIAYYKCICDCGNFYTGRGDTIKRGATSSCGCKKSEMYQRMRLPNDQGVINTICLKYKRSAEARNIPFDLTSEEVGDLVRQHCNYCGCAPSNVLITRPCPEGFLYTGIDRIDSNLGYTEENTVPCCKRCNFAKLTSTIEEFFEWISRVYEYNHLEGLPNAKTALGTS